MAKGFLKYFKGDRVIWFILFILSIFSLLAVYSSTGTLAYKNQGGNTVYYLLRHASFLALGLGIVYVTHLIPYKYFSLLAQLLLLLSFILLPMTIFLGVNENFAVRRFALPGLNLTFQTSDLAKLALIMYVARYLSRNQAVIHEFKSGLIPIIVPIAGIVLLIMPQNLSTALMLFGTCLVLLFIGRVKLTHIGIVIGTGLLAMVLLFLIMKVMPGEDRTKTWENRIERFFSGDDEEDYQVKHANIAIAKGIGVMGVFPGNSQQRNFLPSAYADFIYAIIIEEFGLFLGGILVLLLFLILLYRAGLMVRKSSRTFPAFLAIGLTMNIVFQAMINMGVAVGLLPVTGQPLPWISMGGTSIIFTGISFGMILSVSRSLQNEESHDE